MTSFILRAYEKSVLKKPLLSLVLLLMGVAVIGSFAKHFKLDASADSLVLENDQDLRYFREINKKYGSQDFLIITFTPRGDLLSDESLKTLEDLRDDLAKLERVDSVVTILDVPLLNSPKISIADLDNEVRTLKTPGLDKEMARREFLESPIYHKMLVSPDGKTTAVLAYLERDETYFDLLKKRNDLREKRRTVGLTGEEKAALADASQEFKRYLAHYIDYQAEDVVAVREVMDQYRGEADMFLGGVSMITSDMIHFIKSDLAIFGWGVLLFMIAVMWFFFRRKRWIILPMGCCFIAALSMVGFLGYLDWRITVISSNFISILLIITISWTIHLIVRYGELYAANPKARQAELVDETIRHMGQPCFYTAITTIVAFTSLVVSGIRPVIDFGWIMTMGISVAFILTFIFFPSLLALMNPEPSVYGKDRTKILTLSIAALTINQKTRILILTVILTLASVFGIFRLQVDNRFIDYFKTSTEIYQGMNLIDRKLGGTTPLDIVINPDQDYFEFLEEMKQQRAEEADDPFEEDPFGGQEENNENYWFHAEQLEVVEAIHDYLESLPEIGKVVSIATTFKIVKMLNDGRVPDDYDLALYRKLFPAEAKKAFITPYLSEDANQVRINMRIVEADPDLNRGDLVEKIRRHLEDEMGIDGSRFRFTGMAVLYNNMLQSLYQSQILTLGMVFVAILLMFAILFRSVYLAMIGIVPNLLSAGLVLGLMGWLHIPLDMMTITIAAITIGIAVDDTIHYICRFKEEFAQKPDYLENVRVCHGSTGRAMYYTSITVTLGFSILTLSNFIPTIYFGLLTGFAMIVALLNNLILLPLLIIVFKPMGPDTQKEAAPMAAARAE